MSYRILSPTNSFVQFGESNATTSCNFADIVQCLPVFEDDDVFFQFIVQADTSGEADDLCDLTNNKVVVALAADCAGSLIKTFSQKPDRFRISDTQVLYNWSHGLPDFKSVVNIGNCFVIKVAIDITVTACSNCFQRILSDCHTSVIEYGNDDNFAGFNYCNSGGVTSDSNACDPTFISFTNATTLAIPYNASMVAKYGFVPTVKVWIYDTDGQLTNMSVSQKFDAYPPTELRIDMGGVATGIVKIS